MGVGVQAALRVPPSFVVVPIWPQSALVLDGIGFRAALEASLRRRRLALGEMVPAQRLGDELRTKIGAGGKHIL